MSNNKWKVSHEIGNSIIYKSGPLNYQSLGITLVCCDSIVSQIIHEFDSDESLNKANVAEFSTKKLTLLWEIIHYRWGYPAQVIRRNVEALTDKEIPVSTTNLVTINGVAAITQPVQLPEESKLSIDRLSVWLRLANEARQPTSDVNAIRNYYMIWEDMSLPTNIGDGRTLRFIRNFVSHGGILRDRDLITFLNTEFGVATNRFDPLNQDHKNYISRKREWARNLVDNKINSFL